MKKAVVVFLLAILIFLTCSFIYLKIGSLGEEDNYFNTNLRAKFAVYPLARSVLSLHFDGDAKDDYLGKQKSKILIEVDAMSGLLRRDRTGLELLKKRISETTGKEVSYVISDEDITYEEKISSEQLENLVTANRTFKSLPETAILYLLITSQLEGEPQLLGATHEEYGIILFEDSIKEFVRTNSAALPYYEQSTALHEFGHQIGLSHNAQQNCLMNASAEESQVAVQDTKDVVTDFCEFEKSQISKFFEVSK